MQTLLVLFVVGLGGLIYRELRIANPLINFRTLADRNFRSCCIIIFCAFGVLYANTTTLPGLLQSLFGYDATTSGLVLSPAGVFAVMMLLRRRHAARARRRCALSDGRRAADDGRRQLLDVAAEPGHQPVAGRLAAGGGDRRAVDDLRAAERGGVSATSRRSCAAPPSGCSRCCATKAAASARRSRKTIHERREQFHTLRLNEHLDALNPAVNGRFRERGQAFFLQHTGDPPLSHQMTLQALERLRHRQALSLAYFDVFTFLAAVGVVSSLSCCSCVDRSPRKARTWLRNSRTFRPGVPSLATVADVTTCLERQVACRTDQLLENRTPRLGELLGLGGVTLP